MTKEEVYLSRSLFTRIFPTHSNLGITPEEYNDCKNRLDKLYLKSKSIQDLQKEAFEAGRSIEINSGISSSSGEAFCEEVYKYETFEDYLKTIENG